MATPDTVEITFSHPHGDHAVGDRVTVPRLEAKNLVRAGVAVYPTKAAATAAEGDAGEEKTARAVKAKAKAEPSAP